MTSSSPEPSPSGTPSQVLSVRIVSLDYYMAPPIPGLDISYSPFHCEEVGEVPVIRIYGSTPAGQKTCLHIHRALPYLYVPCPEELLHNIERGNSCMTGLLSDLEKALQNRGPAKRKHVHGCSLVRAKKLYGYHSSEELFVKIYLYYPHEVSRAATHLLSGAVLDRVFQPYESHIPYLLHFLVDYNLYGMGHVHVTDFKFRPPLPDDFHPKTLHRKVESSAESEHKAHSYNATMKNPTIWISSTAPHALILGDSATSHWMGGAISNLTKRHTSMMLEADSRVEGIINEKYKIYTSLSQTTTDTKMVQSLLAIWEELEHLRLLEDKKPADIGRPLRDVVLKSFLHGIKYESALSMLDSKEEGPHRVSATEDSEKLEKCFKSLTDIIGTITFSQNDNCNNIDSDNSAQRTTQLFDENEKHLDAEALGLLSWMASSQAGEEPTTDDELINEVILSPLYSKKSIEVAIESAHLDFDSASQQECQDILDSLEPVTGAEELNAPTSYHSSAMLDDSTSLSNTIPQIDGSSDEKQKAPQEYDQGKITRRKIGTRSSSKRGGSTMPTEKDPSSCKNETERYCHVAADDTDNESSSSIGEHGSACQSVRDLMRRRRRRGSYQPEQLEFGSSGAAACTKDDLCTEAAIEESSMLWFGGFFS